MTFAGIIILTALTTAVIVWLLPRLRLFLPGRLSGLDPYHFEVRTELLGVAENNVDIDVFSIAMRGRIVSPCDHCDTDVTVELQDITDGSLQPLRILCTEPRMQRSGGVEFFASQHNGIIPGRDAILPKWQTVLELPSNILRFPKRGQRTLQFVVQIRQAGQTRLLVEAKTKFNYFVAAQEGYLDFEKRLEEILAAGYLIGRQAAGDQPSQDQQNLLEQWLSDCLHNSAMNMTIDVARIIPAESAQAAFHKACTILQTRSDEAFRQGLTDLCVRIGVTEGSADRSRQQWLQTLAKELQITPACFQAMMQKYMPLEQQENNPDPLVMLGIDPHLPAEELQKRLTDEYRKWNSRVNHPDPNIRKRADQMLSYLTALRGQMQKTEI